MATTTKSRQHAASGRYHYLGDGVFRIDDYDRAPGFCSFLPGIAGPLGVPLWCMYVNRAQGVVSFGMTGKDSAIAEFLPATWAYQLVGVQGFRTFCLIDGTFYEPFQNNSARLTSRCRRSMEIEADRLRMREVNEDVELQFDVEYFAVVNRTLPALVRRMVITNRGHAARDMHILDGLPLILPAAFNDFTIKKMRHISEAYASVRLASPYVPFYAPKVQQHDEAEVVEVRQGNFYAAWIAAKTGYSPVRPIFDPHIVFGAAQDLITPRRFIADPNLATSAQVWENRLPCAITPVRVRLEPGEAITIYALAGAAPDEAMVVPFLDEFAQPKAFDTVSHESRALIEDLTRPALTLSNRPTLDGYARMNYLDNVLRGGIPIMLPSTEGPRPLHLYARRHGDLERDYNEFLLAPHPLADGPGNYRDICQNRRHDVWIYPETGDSEIRGFLGLIQADGYNPLAISGYRWQSASEDTAKHCPAANDRARAAFASLVQSPFAPGRLLGWLNEHGVHLPDPLAWLRDVLATCKPVMVAAGHEGGYWIDHWTYIVDLLEAFAGLWPERVEPMLTAAADIPWFDEGVAILPRRDKHVERHGKPLQLHAIAGRNAPPCPLPPVTPFAKLAAIVTLKALSLDRQGRGVEMDAGRPGWNDAMNGLPALFGSSPCETAEIARLARWLLDAMPGMPDTAFPVIVAAMLEDAADALAAGAYDYDRCAAIRERYNAAIAANDSAECRTLPGSFLKELLIHVERCALRGVHHSTDPDTGLLHTYYIGRAESWTTQTLPDGTPRLHPVLQSPLVDIARIEYTPLPLFLEGQVHRLRLLRNNPQAARKIYQSVRQSPLFDDVLAMYKLNEPLAAMPKEIGRARTFSRGWFENESVWLHMSYKYLLELIQTGLYDEFFRDAETMLVPFMNPDTYGRSTLENASFIACSACPDPNARGRGFIARLSGSTAEFIHIWLLLTIGAKPFRWNGSELTAHLEPKLPGTWFTTEPQTIHWKGCEHHIPANCFACAFLAETLLVYHNPARKDTFGTEAVTPRRWRMENDIIDGHNASGPLAEAIRARRFPRIDVELA